MSHAHNKLSILSLMTVTVQRNKTNEQVLPFNMYLLKIL